MVPSTKTETYVTVSTDEEGNTVKRVITRTILSEKVFLFVVLKFDLHRLTIVKCKYIYVNVMDQISNVVLEHVLSICGEANKPVRF